MKKIIRIFTLILMFVPVFTFALSVDEISQYDIDENMSVGFDNNWYVFTILSWA